MSPSSQMVYFLLFVTGQGETGRSEEVPGAKGLADFLGPLSGWGSFKIEQWVGQLRPPQAPPSSRVPKITGTAKVGATKAEELGWRIRRVLEEYRQRYPAYRLCAVLIDDLEKDLYRAEAVFRYYAEGLKTADQAFPGRTAVHFLVPMLEAYFFADPEMVNQALGQAVLPLAVAQDVENLDGAKGKFKAAFAEYQETVHAPKILQHLRLEYVLQYPDCCAYLRALVRWLVAQMETKPFYASPVKEDRYCLRTGRISDVTGRQIPSR